MKVVRPQAGYRKLFRQQLLAEKPSSVLDVGAGGGEMVRWLWSEAIEAVGLEADPGLAAPESGIQCGRAELMPFEDNAFDFVVSEFSLHHFDNAAAVLREAMRVARRGVMILDMWYDTSRPDQCAAKALDEWFKHQDRCTGMVHANSYTADQLHTLMADMDVRYRLQTMLTPVPLADEGWQPEAEIYLERHAACCASDASLQALKQKIAADGITDDGALVLTVGLD
ncbi:MAG: class I SAM-dependent methyltransferase [Alphaproteobacteria bacterium]|nr:class I SAM-dependent methyltransferase [Alphaproteobacteria bacterium]